MKSQEPLMSPCARCVWGSGTAASAAPRMRRVGAVISWSLLSKLIVRPFQRTSLLWNEINAFNVTNGVFFLHPEQPVVPGIAGMHVSPVLNPQAAQAPERVAPCRPGHLPLLHTVGRAPAGSAR